MTLNIEDLLESSDLFSEAFTHKSASSKIKNFERLEFLGDSLIGAAVTELLFKAYPQSSEGDLSRWRSAIVGQASLAEICDDLGLTLYLRCKDSERLHLQNNPRIKASLVESFAGAYFLFKGSEALQVFFEQLFKEKIKEAEVCFSTADYKTLFQEEAQKRLSQTPTYKTLSKTGPSHRPHFKVAVCLSEEVFTTAEGTTIREAQRAAAKKAMEALKNIRSMERPTNEY